MTDKELDEILRNASPTELAQHVDLARRKAQVAMAVAFTVGAFAVLIALITLALVARNDTSSRNNAAKQLQAVRSELNDTKTALDKLTANNIELDQCNQALTGTLRTANRNYQAALGNLIVIIATTIPEERAQKIGDGVTKLGDTLTLFTAAGDALSTWQALAPDEQLPCPVPVG